MRTPNMFFLIIFVSSNIITMNVLFWANNKKSAKFRIKMCSVKMIIPNKKGNARKRKMITNKRNFTVLHFFVCIMVFTPL